MPANQRRPQNVTNDVMEQPIMPPHMRQKPQEHEYTAPARGGRFNPSYDDGSANPSDGQPPEYSAGNTNLEQCVTCGRSFNPVAMSKHAKICKKVFVDKRKTFNIQEQRKATDANGKGLEDEQYGRRKQQPARKPDPPKKQLPASNMPKWKI